MMSISRCSARRWRRTRTIAIVASRVGEPERASVGGRPRPSATRRLTCSETDARLTPIHRPSSACTSGEALLLELVEGFEVVGRRVSRVEASWAQTTIRPVTPPERRRAADGDAPRRLFLLDGHSLAYRAFFALPPTLATSSGTVTNAVYGFTSMLIKLLAEEQPDLIAVFFDSGAPTVRLAKDAEYKAGPARDAAATSRPQLGLIEEVLEALEIPVLRIADGNEADDAIGTLAVEGRRRRASTPRSSPPTATSSSWCGPGITVMFNRKGISDIVRYDEAAVTERFGITPSQYLDFVALKGDTSDNIPGRAGGGGQDGREADQPVRHGRGAPRPHRSAEGQAEGERRGQRRAPAAQQGARPDRHRRPAARHARRLRDGGLGRRGGPAAVHLAGVPEPVRPAAGHRPRRQAQGRRRRTRPA